MNSRIVNVLLAVACVALAGIAVVAAIHSKELEAQLRGAEASQYKLSASPTIRDEGMAQLLGDQEAANAKLRAEVARLKQSMAASPPAPESTNEAPNARANGPVAWLDRIKQEDPERYKQIVEQREQRRKATDKWYQDQIAVLDQTAQTAPSKDEAEISSQIADTLAKLNDLRTQWSAVREMPEDQREEAVQQLQADTRDTYGALSDLRTRYQDVQFNKVLADAGVDPKTIQTAVTQINQVLMDSRNLLPPRGGGGWGSGPGRGDTPGGQTQAPPPPH